MPCFCNISYGCNVSYSFHILFHKEIPFLYTMCPKYSILLLKNSHLDIFSLIPAFSEFLKTSMCFKSFSLVCLILINHPSKILENHPNI